MGIKFSNNAIGTLASGIDAITGTVPLTAGHGARFPTLVAGDFFYARLKKATNEVEIVKATANAADTLTVTRAQDGSSPLTFSAGDEIRITWPRASIERVRDEARQPAAVEAITGVVGLTATDKLKQKIATASSTITLPAAADLETGDWIDFKSTTTGLVKILPAGADTLDGDAAPAYYRLPAFADCRVMKSGTGAYILARRPQREVGEVFFYPAVLATPLKGTLFASGASLATSTYAGLFDAYGYTHGGAGANFANVDMRDRVPVGRGDMGGAAAGLLTSGGTDTDTANFNSAIIGAKGGSQSSQRHAHGVDDPGHPHTLNVGNSGAGPVGATSSPDAPSLGTAPVNAATTGITIQNAAGGQSGNVQPSLVGNWLVQL